MFQEIQDWEYKRLGKFTASEMHRLMSGGKRPMTDCEIEEAKNRKDRRRTVDTLFGDGARSYINEKISELITGQPIRDLSGIKQTEWGLAHEFECLNELEKHIGIPVQIFGGSTHFFCEFNEYSGGSPDALTDIHVIEAKCPFNSAIHVENLIAAKHGKSNEWMKGSRYEYYVQIQFNMLCCKKGRALFVSYDPRVIDETNRLAVVKITEDPEIQNEIKLRVDKAAEAVSAALDIVFSSTPPLLIASPGEGVTLIEPAK